MPSCPFLKNPERITRETLKNISELFLLLLALQVYGHGSQAVYHDGNHDDNDVMVLKHFLQNGQVYIVDGKTRKTKHVR